jgi:signal transduction histidine kinase
MCNLRVACQGQALSLERQATSSEQEKLMERTYQRKSVDVSNERFVAGSQNGAAIASRPILMARGRHADLKGWEHTAQESERLALLGTTAAVFAHEVANPLNGISTALQLVKHDLEGAEYDVRVLIARLRDALLEIDRLGSLLKEFRDAHPQTTHLQNVNLAEITEEVLACQWDTYGKAGITAKLEFDNALPVVMADPDKIKQAVLNLCNNAVEAMPDGGYLTVKGYHFAGTVILEIRDTGAAIPKGLDVFELFRTTKCNGSGLGLALVRQIVLAHNGTINYTSEPGRGTTFKLYLPAADWEK